LGLAFQQLKRLTISVFDAPSKQKEPYMAPTVLNLSKRDQAAIAIDKLHLRYGLLRTIVRWLSAVAMIWISPHVIAPLAGKDTAVALNVALFGNIKFIVSIGLTGAASIWAVAERTLRQRKVEYLQGRIRELETLVDKNRSSSKLTPKGQTNPRDKI
jgi:hypothetical protein